MRSEPIILTAVMGKQDQAWANSLRRLHFPFERNHLDAHITLFHHLAPSLLAELKDRLRNIARGAPPEAWLSDVMNLGRGVAFRVESPGLIAMRDDLAAAFHGMLTPQDQHSPRLHITVQNKVDPAEARQLRERLASDFEPRMLQISGLAAWYYMGGPWEPAFSAPFRG